MNFRLHGISFGAPGASASIILGGFGPLYNAAEPPKQASYLPEIQGFASAGGGAYLEVAKRLVEIS
jgi:hypothetical protein